MKPKKTPDAATTPEPADPGALLVPVPPPPPPPSTVRMTIPDGCTWSTRHVLGATQIDVVLPRRRGGRP